MATSQPLLMHSHWEKYTPKEKLHKKITTWLENYLTLHMSNNREQGLSPYLFIVFHLSLLKPAEGFRLTQKSKFSYQEENFDLSDC